MDKSKLPKMTRNSYTLPSPSDLKTFLKNKKKKKSGPGSVDDDSVKRAKTRNQRLKEAAK